MTPIHFWLPESFKYPLPLMVLLHISSHTPLSELHIVFSPACMSLNSVHSTVQPSVYTAWISEPHKLSYSPHTQSVWSDFFPTHIAVSPVHTETTRARSVHYSCERMQLWFIQWVHLLDKLLYQAHSCVEPVGEQETINCPLLWMSVWMHVPCDKVVRHPVFIPNSFPAFLGYAHIHCGPS